MKKILVGIFTLCSAWLHAQDNVWTLEQCVNHAQQNNLSIQQYLLDEKSAEIDKKDAIGSFFPSINASGSHSWTVGLNQNITTGLLENQTTQFTSAGFDVGIDLYKGGQNHKRMRRADLSILAARYQTDKIIDDVSLNVVNAYLQVIFSKEILKANLAQLQFDQQQLSRVQSLVDAGSSPQGDVLDSQATVEASKQNVVAAENNLKLAKLALAQLLQIEDYQNFDVADESFEIEASEVLLQDPQNIIERSKEVIQDYKILETQVKLAETDVSIAKSSRYPSVRAFYNLATRAAHADVITDYIVDVDNPQQIGFVEGTNQRVLTPNTQPVFGSSPPLLEQFDLNKGHNFGIGISIPILNGFSVKNNIKRAELAYEKALLAVQENELQLEQKVYTAYTDTHGALQTYQAAKTTFLARTQSMEYAQQRYDVGLINIFDLNQNQNMLVAAQSELLRAKYDFIFKTKILEYYFGLPIFKLD